MPKSIIILILGLFTFSSANCQTTADSTNLRTKHYPFYFVSDILSVGINYDFIKDRKWAVGIEVLVGSGFRLSLTNPDNYYNCTKQCDEDNIRLLFEGVKVKPYFRYYYFNDNNIDIGVNFSWMDNLLLDEMTPTETSLSYGIDISIFYGWDGIKLGTGFEFNLNTIEREKDDINSRFIILWTPIKLQIPIQKKHKRKR